MNIIKTISDKKFMSVKVLLTLIYIVLEIYYFKIIVPEYNHLGYDWSFNLYKYIITKAVFVLLLLVSTMLFEKSKFLYSVYLLLIFFFYIPNAILFSLANMEFSPYLSNVFFVFSFILSGYINIKLPNYSINDKYKSVALLALGLLALLPIVFVFKTQINFKTLLLKEIYETRELFSQKLIGIFAYLYHIAVKTILPIGLIFFLIKKKPAYVIAYFLMLLYLFVISGNKFVYFTSFILMVFYYLGKDQFSKIRLFFVVTLILFLVFPIIDYYIFKADKPILTGTFVNRFLFTPSILTQWYFEFFEGKPFYFAESHLFNKFVQSPYDMPVGFLISKVYLNEPTVYANNGLVSDGFMNLGYWGVAVFSIIFSILFSLFNSLKLNAAYFGLFFAYIYMFLSAQFLSCFITGGILLFIFLTIFILRDKQTAITA